MKPLTAITVHLYVSKEELINVNNGGMTMVAHKTKTSTADIHVSLPLSACDIMEGNEVRVNIPAIQVSVESIGKTMGEAVGAELEKVFAGLPG